MRIEEQNTAELLVEIGNNIEELTEIGVHDGDRRLWLPDASQLEVFKHQAISSRLPPLPTDGGEEKEKEIAAIKECKVEIEARANSSVLGSRKRLDVVFKNGGEVPIPVAGARLSWTYTPPRSSPSQPGKPKVALAEQNISLTTESRAKSIKPGEEMLFVLDDDMSSPLVELLRGDVRDEDIKIEVATSVGWAWAATMDTIPTAVKEVAQSVLESLHRAK